MEKKTYSPSTFWGRTPMRAKAPVKRAVHRKAEGNCPGMRSTARQVASAISRRGM